MFVFDRFLVVFDHFHHFAYISKGTISITFICKGCTIRLEANKFSKMVVTDSDKRAIDYPDVTLYEKLSDKISKLEKIEQKVRHL